jgi:LysR family glycine cleavage system transcriptional activator
MRITSPSLPELHAFIRVAELGSFSLAANVLCVTQGGVSRSIQRLEMRLGTTLLERAARGVALTPEGRVYFLKVQPAIAALEEAAVQMGGNSPSKMALRVSAIPTLNMRWLVPRLPAFYAQHPNIQLVLKPYLADDDFLRQDVDCWLQTRASSASRWPAHVRATYIMGREIVPICHPSVAHRIHKPDDLLQFPLLHHTNYPGNWPLWLHAMGLSTGARLPPLGPGFDLVAGLIEAVKADLGVAVVQRCLLGSDLTLGLVAAPLSQEVSTKRGYYFCVPKARAIDASLTAFQQWLIRTATT